MQQYIPRYDTLPLLGESSLFLIEDRLKRFLAEFGPLTWPLDCFRLVDEISSLGRMPLDVIRADGFTRGFDAVTEYSPALRRYLLVMRQVPPGWKERSAGRRVNFTVAHELGHIFLGHLSVPREAKPEAWLRMEDAEADEFASRLLMPEELILNARFASRAEMAAGFLVSDRACFRRLNSLRRLDRFAEPAPVCPKCGNRKISPIAGFCRACGAFLGRRIPDRIAAMMPPPRPKACPACGSEWPPGPEDECEGCGTPRRNFCLAEYDQPRHPNPPDALYCETCGAVTSLEDYRAWKKAKANPGT